MTGDTLIKLFQIGVSIEQIDSFEEHCKWDESLRLKKCNFP